jgi:hypothetical protein
MELALKFVVGMKQFIPTAYRAHIYATISLMNKNIILLVVLIIGLGGGYYLGYDHGWEKALTDHKHGGSTILHDHGQMEAVSPIPSVGLQVHQDPKSGWNAQISLSNFRFAPERVGMNNRNGEGHVHIYVDGVKINRVYGEWYYLGELSPGTHEVLVTLSTNDHKELVRNGELISDSVTIEVPETGDSTDPMRMDVH